MNNKIDTILIISHMIESDRLSFNDLLFAKIMADKRAARKENRVYRYAVSEETASHYNLDVIMTIADDCRDKCIIRKHIPNRGNRIGAAFVHCIINTNAILQDKVFAQDRPSIYRLG